ncbi:MAG: hypothetical protein WCN92_00725 [Eubacteriales bacterium]
MKRIFAIACVILSILALTSCSSMIVITNPQNDNSDIDKSTSLATTSVPITMTVEPKTEISIQEKFDLAPDLEGTKKVIKKINDYERVTYERDGVYIGEYKNEVYFEGTEVGGVALIPTVVEQLLNDGLSNIPEGQDKWMVFVPADITEFKNSETKVSIKIIDLTSFKDFVLKIDFNETISISNPVIDTESHGVHNTLILEAFTDTPFGIGINTDYDDVPTQKGINVFGDFKFKEKIFGKIIPFGEKMTEANNSIRVIIESNVTTAVIDKSRILRIDNSPIFVIDI